MALTLSLVERTGYRLRYLAVSDGQGQQGPLEVTAITNRTNGTGVAGQDLFVDTANFQGFPIWRLVNTLVATTAAARQVLGGDGLTALSDLPIERGHILIRQRNSFPIVLATAADWSADAVEGSTVDPASTGRPVIVITGPNVQNAACYIDLTFQHSYDR